MYVLNCVSDTAESVSDTAESVLPDGKTLIKFSMNINNLVSQVPKETQDKTP